MMYNIYINNDFSVINQPIILSIGKNKELVSGYKYQELINRSRIKLRALDDGVQILDNITFMSQTVGSHAIQVFIDDSMIDIFNIYTYENLTIINQHNLYTIFTQELPAIYNQNNPYNYADNYATSKMFAELYKFIYTAYYNAFTSLGKDGAYNIGFEELYFGRRGIISGSSNPSQILKLLIQISNRTGITYKDISIFLSRLIFAVNGAENRVHMYQNAADEICNIDVYLATGNWQLGVTGNTELGITTILGSPASQSLVNYLLVTMLTRLMPTQVKWIITAKAINDFSSDFNSNDVLDSMYIKDSVYYDAYGAVNNNNVFNMKGYNKNV